MENSMTSMSKLNLPKPTADSDDHEESSWTFYFEDLLCENERSCFSSGYESPSLVSDAASIVGKKLMDDNDHHHHQIAETPILTKTRKNLSYKKRKTKGSLVDIDHSLEDTASSPANSPKEKGNTSDQTFERSSSELGMVGRDSDYTELQKKGLCLVPVSMLANYLG
ncbi:H/ACA ribonucleoprotein complex subunit like [Actinidia chinensis var. chinensis]|uniref:H/ACA ribonucleoprotein complex subunit like n=1 Tax=Actinidia chinensis var. chinensis TaxID=1590841 RepID=A0A2R6QDD5_ACTCC|nr:H/ACA ribonucleoprotein complex subunit like [Actinidia chinensis var. chinensis]